MSTHQSLIRNCLYRASAVNIKYLTGSKIEVVKNIKLSISQFKIIWFEILAPGLYKHKNKTKISGSIIRKNVCCHSQI